MAESATPEQFGAAQNILKRWQMAVASFPASIVVSYAFLYFAYFQFYVPFGLRPADVGLTRGRMLQESLLGPLMIPLSLIVRKPQVLLLLLFVALGVRLVSGLRGLRRKSPRTPGRPAALIFTALFAAYWIVFTISGFLLIVRVAHSAGERVYDGEEVIIAQVVNSNDGNLFVPLLDIKAIPAAVTYEDNEVEPPVYAKDCLLYLGSSGGRAVVFDTADKFVLLLKEDSVSLSLNLQQRDVPEKCGRPIPPDSQDRTPTPSPTPSVPNLSATDSS